MACRNYLPSLHLYTPALLLLMSVCVIFNTSAAPVDTLTIKKEIRKLDTMNIDLGLKEKKAKELIRISDIARYTEGSLHASYILATSYFFRQKYSASFEVLDSILSILDHAGENNLKIKNIEDKKARVYSFMGMIFDEIGDYGKAMDFYIKSLRTVESSGDLNQKSILYKNLGMTNLAVGNVPKAKEYFARSRRICDSLNDKKTVFDIMNSLQSYYADSNLYDSALLYGLKLLTISKEIGDQYSLALANYSLGNIYNKSKHLVLATAYFNESLHLAEVNRYKPLQAESLLGLASLATSRGDNNEALNLLQKAYNLAEETDLLNLKIEAAGQLSEVYALLRDYSNAYKFNRIYLTYIQEENQKKNSAEVLGLQARYEMEKINREKAQLEDQLLIKQQRLSNQRFTLILSITIILLLIAFIVMLIRRYRHIRSLNNMLGHQQLIINQQEESLHKKQQEELQLEIEHKNREMTSIALALAQENEFKDNLIEDLEHFKISSSIKKNEMNELNGIISSIRQNISNSSWQEFRTYFENVYSQFYANIESEYPMLSHNDKRLCAMLKLGLSTKEISMLTYREIKSVESARNRLRKKLMLDPKENLSQFLSRF